MNNYSKSFYNNKYSKSSYNSYKEEVATITNTAIIVCNNTLQATPTVYCCEAQTRRVSFLWSSLL
jgi:hypothetical protein